MSQDRAHANWIRGILAAERERLGWSLSQAARAVAKQLGRVSLTKQSFTRWEKGEASPTIDQYSAWASALGFVLHLDLTRRDEDRSVIHVPSEIAGLVRDIARLSPEDISTVRSVVTALSQKRI